jgi:peroxiredoxin
VLACTAKQLFILLAIFGGNGLTKRILALLLLPILLAGCTGEDNRNSEGLVLPVMTQSMEDHFPGLGGVMPELTVTTSEGETLILSDILKEKKLVVLNFWASDSTWCWKELSTMEQAYRQYREDVQIIALNPVDPVEAVEILRKGSAVSFPMAVCPGAWVVEMGVRGYPTSIFIDRDGVVCLIHPEGIDDAQALCTIFETFTADDYQRKIYLRIDELLQ